MPPDYGSIDTSKQRVDSKENQELSGEQLDQLFEGAKPEIKLEEALEKAGFGITHALCLLGLGVVIMGAYGQMEANNLLGPELLCEWKLTGAKEASITASLYVGCALGTVFWGKISDTIGRRLTVMTCSFFTFTFLIISMFSRGYIFFAICRIATGIFFGPLLLCYTYATELVSTKYRSTAALFLYCSQTVGAFYATSMALLVIPTKNLGWQLYLALMSIPFFLGFIIVTVLPETPRFLLTSGKADEALKVVQCFNRSQNHLVKLKSVEAEKRGSFRTLFNNWEYVKTLIALLITTAVIRMNKKAVGLLFVESLQIPKREEGCLLVSGYHDVHIKCERLQSKDYKLVIVLACSYAIAATLSKPMADFFGRRKSLLILGSLSFIQLSLFLFCKPDLVQTFLALSCRAVLSTSLMVSYLFINESFPTNIRALSFATILFLTDFVVILAPVVVQFLSKISFPAAVSTLMFSAALWTITMIMYRRETKDLPLMDCNEQQKTERKQTEQPLLKNDSA